MEEKKSTSPLRSSTEGKGWSTRLYKTGLENNSSQSSLPAFSTHCDNLSFNNVNHLHEAPSSSGRPSYHLSQPVHRLRFTLTKISQSIKKNEEKINDSTVSNTSHFTDEKYQYEKRDIIVKHPISFTGPVFQPSYLLDQLFNDKSYYENESKSHRHTREFLKENQLQVAFILLDINMQVIGTYDPFMKSLPSGITVGPDYLTKSGQENENGNHCHVVEFNIDLLTANVFAVVPLILGDHGIYGDEALNEKYEYNTFIHYTAQYRRKSVFDDRQGLDMHTSANLDPKVLGILNDSIKIIEFDPFGEEKRISPPQRIIQSKCDGMNTNVPDTKTNRAAAAAAKAPTKQGESSPIYV